MLAEGDEGDPVTGRLRGHERGCGRTGLGERLARHGARSVECEYDVLAAAKVDRLHADDRASVLEEGRRRLRRRRSDHRRAHVRVGAEIEPVEPDAGVRFCCREQSEQ
jgi:hypothetical protein